MTFLLTLVGFIVVITGAAWIATVAGVSQTLIIIGAVILLGIALFTSFASSRATDPA